MTRIWPGLLAAVLLTPSLLAGQTDLAPVYSDLDLQDAARKYSGKLRGLWQEDLVEKLPHEPRQNAMLVQLNLPLRGQVLIDNRVVPSNSPFTYYATPGTLEMTIPVLSVKFLDDIATAASWLDSRKCAPAWVFDYVGMLRYQTADLRPGQRFPSPLSALRAPDNVLADQWVYDVSGKALKSGIYFMMAHELAHILYKHDGSASGAVGQSREMQADAFALDLMRRISVAPVGMVLLFWAASRFEPVPSDYHSPAEYQNQIRAQSTHPLSVQRLNAVAQYIRQHVPEFSRGQPNPAVVTQVVSQVEGIAAGLNDYSMRDYQRRRSRTLTLGQLAAACR